jgi:polar amino acid transport system substrate-binding protein
MMKKFCLSLSLTLISLFIPCNPSQSAEWEEIQKRGELIIAVKDNTPPLGFRDSQGNLQGLEIDIARRLAQELLGDSEAVELIPVNNQDRLKVILDGRVDLTIARVTMTSSRSRIVSFSPYYYLDGTGLISNNPQIQSIGDLRFGKIAVLNYSNTIAIVRYAIPSAQLIPVDSYLEAFYALESGQVDAFAGDYSLLTGWVQEFTQYHRLPNILSGEALAIVMPKGLQYLELHQKVNSAIARWKQEGWLEERINYYQLSSSNNTPITNY